MYNILFVCLGNLCRSPIAAAVASRRASERGLSQQLSFAAVGTDARRGEPADPRAVKVGAARGYALGKHRARRIGAADFARFDLILAMDDANLEQLQVLCPPEHAAKLGRFADYLGGAASAVPDPYYGNLAGFERVFDLCEIGVDALLARYADRR